MFSGILSMFHIILPLLLSFTPTSYLIIIYLNKILFSSLSQVRFFQKKYLFFWDSTERLRSYFCNNNMKILKIWTITICWSKFLKSMNSCTHVPKLTGKFFLVLMCKTGKTPTSVMIRQFDKEKHWEYFSGLRLCVPKRTKKTFQTLPVNFSFGLNKMRL